VQRVAGLLQVTCHAAAHHAGSNECDCGHGM
jgi:hypothetical protein